MRQDAGVAAGGRDLYDRKQDVHFPFRPLSIGGGRRCTGECRTIPRRPFNMPRADTWAYGLGRQVAIEALP